MDLKGHFTAFFLFDVNVFVDSQDRFHGYIPYQYVLDRHNYLQVLITIISI
jgi:hypothetical protein